ncbi:MAG: biotin/lipoate A/B protein ligase family protein [Candidatus Geothermarchaeales archaeon]
METWRLLDLESSDPHWNVAVEEALLQAVEGGITPSTFRLWRNPNSVVIGRFQSVGLEVDVKACTEFDTAIVRRITGGGTVYHDWGNLNWTIVAGRGQPMVSGDFLKVFGGFGGAVVEGLKTMGVKAKFNPPNGIQFNGKKISGMAAYVKRGAVLCHGTLLVNTDLNVLSRVLRALEKPSNPILTREALVRSRPSEVTSLQRELGQRVSLQVVKEAMIRGVEKVCKVKLRGGGLTAEECEFIESLYEEKYGRVEWNLRW